MNPADSMPLAASATNVVSSAPAHFIGGRNWRVADVFWGTPGPKGEAELLGYLARFPGRGRPPGDQVKDRAVDLWMLQAVYCLNAGTHTIYVGEGVLGDRLKEHAQNDAFAGKWDTFSWLAPATYTYDPLATPRASVASLDPVAWSPPAKKFVEFLELIAIQFGMPVDNRQFPELKDEIRWLEQLRSSKLPLTNEQMLRELHAKLAGT